MITALHEYCKDRPYIPVLTEVDGLIMIGAGTAILGGGILLKVGEYFGANKGHVPLAELRSKIYVEMGKKALQLGANKLLPTAAILLSPVPVECKVGVVATRTIYPRLPNP